MPALKDILTKVRLLDIKGSTTIPVAGISFDSRKTMPGDVFVAVAGNQTDGHHYADQAEERGAAAVVVDNPAYHTERSCTSILVDDSSRALGFMASDFYGNPSSCLRLVGITGTNGKTSTTTFLHHLFNGMGLKSGCFTTICNYVGNRMTEATHTTPDPLQLNRVMREMADEGCLYAFMEVSSHAIVQQRIAGLTFAGGVFSNITHDHLDYHKSFDNYIKAKKSFFDALPEGSFALVNTDDPNGKVMTQNTKADIYSYGLHTPADFNATIIESHHDGMLLQIDRKEVWTRIIGQFNAYNLLAVYGCAVLMKLNSEEVLKGISLLGTVRGRFQHLRSPRGYTAIIDYAHTPDAVLNVLKTLQEIRQPGSRIITVVGAGGNRDRTKRPAMAGIAARMSDRLILTSDNPRDEDPLQIIRDMEAGLSEQDLEKTLILPDRSQAITMACRLAGKGDLILVAGKGHENYQEIKGTRTHFSDLEVVTAIFEKQKQKDR